MALPTTIYGRDGAIMVLVPEGEFIMGTDDGEDYEGPAHVVYAPAFYIDVYHVTNMLYKQFVRATKYKPDPLWRTMASKLSDRCPAAGVSWHDAVAYLDWAGKLLPTEVQWEKAARGTDGRRFPWGNRWSRSQCCCWLGGARGIAEVGAYPGDVSPYGCYDMAGNVDEWIRNWATLKTYSELPEGNQGGMEYGNRRSGRGGNWCLDEPNDFMCARRGCGNLDFGHDKVSLRGVLDIESAKGLGLI